MITIDSKEQLFRKLSKGEELTPQLVVRLNHLSERLEALGYKVKDLLSLDRVVVEKHALDRLKDRFDVDWTASNLLEFLRNKDFVLTVFKNRNKIDFNMSPQYRFGFRSSKNFNIHIPVRCSNNFYYTDYITIITVLGVDIALRGDYSESFT
jgi:hypothetical protein